MAGILDKKTRFIDYVITQEGKRQLASGQLRAKYASLTDMHTFYDKSDHESVDDRIYFQVMERPENSIVIEKDDSGALLDFNFSPTGSIVGNDIFDKDSTSTSKLRLNPVTGDNFSSTSEKLMKTFTQHFRKNTFVGTYFSNGTNEFQLSKTDLNFAITNSIPFNTGPDVETINVNEAEPFFFDSKLTHLKNFRYLPPVNTDGSPYGTYQDLRSTKRETFDDIKKELGARAFTADDITDVLGKDSFRQDKMGDFDVINRKKKVSVNEAVQKQFYSINFDKTSKDNNLLIQMFENSRGAKLTKLDIVDAGVFIDPDASKGRNEKQVYYAGKVYMDDWNTPTFINMWTIVFD